MLGRVCCVVSGYPVRIGKPTGENLKEIFRRVAEEDLIDRVIYGSDGPQLPGFLESYTARTVDAMTAANYTAEQAEMVFSGNFETVFGVQP